MITQIQSEKAPGAVGPYSQAIETNGFVFLSGMLPLDVETGEMVGTTASEQAEQIMKNITNLLGDLNLTWREIVKTTIFLDSMSSFQAVNEVYGSYLTDHKPARSCVEVAKLPKGALVEIEVIASTAR